MGLTSVRRPNGPYGFPVSRFHNGVSATGQGRNQLDQADKTVFVDERALRSCRQPLLRQRCDDATEYVARSSHRAGGRACGREPYDSIGPSPNDWVELIYQFLRADRRPSPRAFADLILEVPDGLYPRKRIARSPPGPAPDLRGGQPKGPRALLDLVAKELKPVCHMDNAGLLGVQGDPQLRQDQPGLLYCRTGFRASAASEQPVVGITSQPIAATTHLRSNGVSRILLRIGDTMPPCGVPVAVGNR